jgi:hypothetical protein
MTLIVLAHPTYSVRKSYGQWLCHSLQVNDENVLSNRQAVPAYKSMNSVFALKTSGSITGGTSLKI